MQRARGNRAVTRLVKATLRSPGAPLDTPTRERFERRWGHDLSRVRVHTDAEAGASARAVSAAAYTVGRHIVFDGTYYRPHTPSGEHILAHELAHALGDQLAEPSNNLRLGATHDSAEASARQTAANLALVPGAGAPAGDTLRRMTQAEALAYGEGLDTRYPNWLGVLPPCPCTFSAARASSDFTYSRFGDLVLDWFHPGAASSVRSARGYSTTPGTSHGQQCTYDAAGNLITEGAGAGTPDVWSPVTHYSDHQTYDVGTFNRLGWRVYDRYWRPDPGRGCAANAGDGARATSGRYRIVGAFSETDLFIITIPHRVVSEAEDVQVEATGRYHGDQVGARGHYSLVEVTPINAAARRLFEGSAPRHVPSYLLQGM